jgi:tocopherol O-methyltransferase
MPDKPAFFAQARRVLRPGGRLIVTSWLVGEAPARWQERWLLEPIAREARMPILGTESDYRQWAAEAGFEVGRFQDITSAIARTWPMIVATFVRQLVRHPSIVRLLVRGWSHHSVFAFTITRLCIAFRTGALRYGVFTLSKSGA